MTFEELMVKAVARAYIEDETTPGLTVAYLFNKKCWYASVVRYPQGYKGEKIVEAHGYSRISLKHACKILCISWLQKRPEGANSFPVRVLSLLDEAKQEALR